LNLDGGPLVSQIVHAGDLHANFHGTAEMSDGSDVLRAFWHAHFEATLDAAHCPGGHTRFSP